MKKMTIGTKLMGSAAVMLALTLLLSYSGLTTLSTFKRQFDHAADSTVHKIQLANAVVTANSEMVSVQRGEILAVFAKDAAELEKYEATYQKDASATSSALAEIRPLLVTQEGKALTEEIDQKFLEWKPLHEELLRDCRSGDIAEANHIRKDLMAPIFNKIDQEARRLSAVQAELLETDKAQLAQSYSWSHWIAFALLALSIVAVAGVVLLVRNINRNLRQAVTELSEGAHQVASAASQVSASSQSLAQGASEQAASLEETSASSEEINSMARKNTENSHAAAELVTQSRQKFTETNQSLEQMVAAMTEIKNSSDKISKIIKTIDEIAFQTNILALNAAVEAARAGEAGMGFAVVADEVRSLAQRCAQAAQDTASLIEESIAKSNDGKTKVDQVAVAIRAITEQAVQIKTLVDEVNVGSQEQAKGIEQVAKAVAQMEQVTQKSAASAEEGASAGEELTAQSDTLKEIVGRLSAMVGEDQAATEKPVAAYPPAASRHHDEPAFDLASLRSAASHKQVPAAVASKSALPLDDDEFKAF
ncbi:MAG TPA: methyl-accepting chemotaxis protein [Bryobacteraceae bacterium]|nr:methyl-accepting chemotaxis protein [Bryobacteraceae bacterium]